jgi:hypothetical protein
MQKTIIGVAIFAILAIVLISPPGIQADTQNTTTTVTVNEYVAVGLSNNLSSGIDFGSLDPDTLNNNATNNFDGAGLNTSFWVNISTDSNVNVDICIGDNESLEFGANVIENGNYTWVNTTTGGPGDAWLIVGNSVVMTTTAAFTNAGNNIAPGSYNWYRFWLDIPGGQAAGAYVNSVSFKGIKTGNSCN